MTNLKVFRPKMTGYVKLFRVRLGKVRTSWLFRVRLVFWILMVSGRVIRFLRVLIFRSENL